jgi:hypothetical protein
LLGGADVGVGAEKLEVALEAIGVEVADIDGETNGVAAGVDRIDDEFVVGGDELAADWETSIDTKLDIDRAEDVKAPVELMSTGTELDTTANELTALLDELTGALALSW